MKRIIIMVLLALTLASCSVGIGTSVGRGGVRGHAGIWF